MSCRGPSGQPPIVRRAGGVGLYEDALPLRARTETFPAALLSARTETFAAILLSAQHEVFAAIDWAVSFRQGLCASQHEYLTTLIPLLTVPDRVLAPLVSLRVQGQQSQRAEVFDVQVRHPAHGPLTKQGRGPQQIKSREKQGVEPRPANIPRKSGAARQVQPDHGQDERPEETACGEGRSG
jgi:hypothetical protein